MSLGWKNRNNCPPFPTCRTLNPRSPDPSRVAARQQAVILHHEEGISAQIFPQFPLASPVTRFTVLGIKPAPLIPQLEWHHRPRLAPESYEGFAVVLRIITLERRAIGWLDDSFHLHFRELLLNTTPASASSAWDGSEKCSRAGKCSPMPEIGLGWLPEGGAKGQKPSETFTALGNTPIDLEFNRLRK
jgi:hypothetical protein